MIESLASAIGITLADLPPPFVSADVAAQLETAANHLPPVVRGGFEIHLTPGARRVDLQQCLRRPQGEPGLAAAFIDARARGAIDRSWLRVRDFCRTWADPHSPQYARIRELWLEIDVAETIGAPAVFAALHSPDGRPYDPAPLIESLVAEFMDAAPDSALQRTVRRCVSACTQGAVVSHVGAMLSRRPLVVRLNIKRLTRAAVLPFLERVGWNGSPRQVDALTNELLPQAKQFTLCLDVGDVVSPRVGFECMVPKDAQWESGWPSFLDRFVAAGACTAEAQDALRHWAGTRFPWKTPEPWPPYLVAESLLRAPDRVGVIERALSHLKVDYRPNSPLEVKAYLWFAHRWLRPGTASPRELPLPAEDVRATPAPTPHAYRSQVRGYYDRTNAEYLLHVGSTFQADLISADARGDDPAASNRQLAAWAGIAGGQRVLDAGCGVGGPAVDIAAAIDGVSIEGITISAAQARTARQRIAAAGLGSRVRVSIGDYHDLPYRDGAFDVVVFFESSGYSDDRERLFREVRRVLRPGGELYIKDAFRPDTALSEAEGNGLADFDRIYAHRTPALEATVALLEQLGFVTVRARDLRPFANRNRWGRAMGEASTTIGELTPFGELHFHIFEALPVFPAEIRARTPG